MGTTLDLINAIEAGDSQAIELHFESAMADRIADRLDNMRVEVAKNMFKEDVDVYDYSDIITESDIEEFMQTEEFEQLDELSKKTLGSYVAKAANNMAIAHGERIKKAADADDVDRFMNRNTSVGYQEKNKVTDDMKKALGADSKSITNKMYQAAKRAKGINTALKKLTKEDIEEFMQTEEFEQLDELSKKTLGNYVQKNAISQTSLARKEDELRRTYDAVGKAAMDTRGDASDHLYNAKKVIDKDIDKVRDKQWKRTKGMYTAVKKLTKEDTDQLEENRVPSGIKLYHKDKEGNETYSIHFSGQDAAREEKRRKKMGHKTVAHAVMYGREEGDRVNH